jgi:hypothetical protein
MKLSPKIKETQVRGLQWHRLSGDKATGAAEPENLSSPVQGVCWQGKNYGRR